MLCHPAISRKWILFYRQIFVFILKNNKDKNGTGASSNLLLAVHKLHHHH